MSVALRKSFYYVFILLEVTGDCILCVALSKSFDYVIFLWSDGISLEREDIVQPQPN